jgi:tetratricopeptide (TPR) repeat protein
LITFCIYYLPFKREIEGVAFLKKALEFDPYMENVLINIGSYYQDEGDLSTAETYFRQGITSFKGSALRLKSKDYDSSNLLIIRISIMIHPIAYDWDTMINDRRRMENNLIYLLRLTDLNGFHII